MRGNGVEDGGGGALTYTPGSTLNNRNQSCHIYIYIYVYLYIYRERYLSLTIYI